MGLQTGQLSHSIYIYIYYYIYILIYIYIHDSVWQFEKGTCVTAQTCANPSVVRVTFFVRYRSKPWLDRIHLGLISYKVVCQFFSIVTKVYDRYIELVWGTWDGHVGWFQGMSFKWYVLPQIHWLMFLLFSIRWPWGTLCYPCSDKPMCVEQQIRRGNQVTNTHARRCRRQFWHMKRESERGREGGRGETSTHDNHGAVSSKNEGTLCPIQRHSVTVFNQSNLLNKRLRVCTHQSVCQKVVLTLFWFESLNGNR